MRILAACILILFIVYPGLARAGEFHFYVGELYPFVIIDAPEEIRGAVVDVVTQVMEQVGMPVEQGDLRNISWARAQEIVVAKPGNALFCMARTPQREHKYRWVGPVATLSLGLIARKDSGIVIREHGDVAGYRIAVVRGSGPQHILSNTYGIEADDLELVRGGTHQYRMLEAGRVDLIPHSDIAAPTDLRKLGMNPDDYEMVHVMRHLELYVAFNRATDTELISRMQEVLDGLKKKQGGTSLYDQIMERYLVGGPISMQE